MILSHTKIPGFLFAALMMCSCKKFVQVDAPPTQIQSKQIFSEDQPATAAVTGLYAMLGAGNLNLLNGGLSLYAGAYADEIYPTAANTDITPFYTNEVATNHSNLYNRLWRAAYGNNGIYTANAVLEGLEKSKTLTDSVQRRLRGEVKVIRALEYFYLVNLFGAIPLVTTTDFESNAVRARTNTEKVYEFLVAELKEAEALLPAHYPTAARGRINKWAAAALLARVYLYLGDWTQAEQKATEVIQCGLYSLNNNLAAVFSTGSNETIWQLVRDNNNTAEGATFIPTGSSVRPVYALTNYLLNAFETGDLRKNAWTGRNRVSGVDYYYPFKYKSRTATQATEYNVLLRLAEQYLIRAEARAKKGDVTGAKDDLNVVRTRAGLSQTTADTGPALVTAILRERRIEFFCEAGHRWFDLKRSGEADAVLSAIKGNGWQTTDLLLPIPQSEIDKNANLQQNPGY